MTVTKLAALLLSRLWRVETRRCAQCWQPMRMAHDGQGNAVLLCPDQCEPGGHVSDIYVDYERMRDEDRARQAAQNYPLLAAAAGYALPSPEERVRGSEALFGWRASDEERAERIERIRRYAELHKVPLPDEYFEITARDKRYEHQRIDEAWRQFSGDWTDQEGRQGADERRTGRAPD